MAEEATLVEIRELEADYEILGELGRGGMSIVYLARDRELGRDVAIKVIHTASSVDDETIARQLSEARTVAQLQHPNVVSIHAVKRLSTRGLALVMQYVPGRSLERAIHEDGPFSPERAEAVLVDIAAALAYAHARGVVHRDVKPENIFLNEETGRALLSDFGIALSAEMGRQQPNADLLVGTPAYMSPEQIDGLALDGRSDVFSLGLVGYEMLAGVRSWVDGNVSDVMYRQKFEPLPAIAGMRGDVPPRLAGVVERALEKDRAARWDGAHGFLMALSDDEWVPDASGPAPTNRVAAHFAPLGAATPASGVAPLHTVQYRRGQHPGIPAAASDADDEAFDDLSLIPVPPVQRRWPMALAIGTPILIIAGVAVVAFGYPELLSRPRPQEVIVPMHADSEQQATLAALRDSASRASAEASRRAADSAAAATAAADSSAAARLIQAARDSEVKLLAQAKKDAPPPAPAPPPAATAAASAESVKAVTPVTGPIIHPPALSPVAAGGVHTCLIDSRGDAQCWGNNDRGQLGVGSTARVSGIAHVGGDVQFSQIAAGVDHSCGVTRPGAIYCWGSNEFGQLGVGDDVNHTVPTKVTAVEHAFRVVAAGNGYTCALTTAGEAYCWGRNLYGELGNGSTSNSATPVRVASGARFVVLAAGAHHACALDQVGQAYCWGQNTYGQLGDGSKIVRAAPALVIGGTAFRAIAAGGYHTCALTTAGQASCWGRNSYGQLGTGDAIERDTPTPVKTTLSFMTLTAGLVHTAAMTSAGDAYSWGRNTYGQLGDGTTADHAAPVRVAMTQPVASIDASGSHTCAATASGATMCWGYNSDGQLGDGTTTHHSEPVAITNAR